MKQKRNNKGFTLVELLLVIAIIAILATVLFVSLGKQRERARKTAFKENMRGLVTTYTACKDGGGTISDGIADGSKPVCSSGPAGIGNIPKIDNCDGASQVTLAAAGTGDFWYVTAPCSVGSVICHAACNADGCIFCNDAITPDANGILGSCGSNGSSNCE